MDRKHRWYWSALAAVPLLYGGAAGAQNAGYDTVIGDDAGLWDDYDYYDTGLWESDNWAYDDWGVYDSDFNWQTANGEDFDTWAGDTYATDYEAGSWDAFWYDDAGESGWFDW